MYLLRHQLIVSNWRSLKTVVRIKNRSKITLENVLVYYGNAVQAVLCEPIAAIKPSMQCKVISSVKQQ